MSYEYRLPVVILLLVVGLGLFARTIYGRFLVLKAGKPETRWDLVENRVRALLEVGLGQAKMFKEPASGLLHALTFWGFVVLGARTTQLFVQGFSPDWPLPFIEPIYAPIKDFTAAIVLLSILGFFYRRLIVKPKRSSQLLVLCDGAVQRFFGFGQPAIFGADSQKQPYPVLFHPEQPHPRRRTRNAAVEACRHRHGIRTRMRSA